MKNKKLSKL